MRNEICPHLRQRIFHIWGANISQRSYFTCPKGKFRLKKKHLQSQVLFFWLPLLDSLFCGKATAVATVHRTVAKSRLSSPTENWDQNAKKEHHPIGWCSFLAPPVGLEPTTCGLTVRRSTDWAKGEYECSRYLFSRPVTRQLSSAYVCLTSVFGMGTGGPTRQSTRTHWDGLKPIFFMSKARRLSTTTL